MEAINKSVQDKQKRNCKTSCSEFEVHNPRFYIIPFVMDWYELGKRIGFYNGTSADDPIELSCDKDFVSQVEESVVLYLNSISLNLEQYESREIVGREDRKINGETLDVIKVHVKYYDIFGKRTFQHLVMWFFKNTLC